MTVMVPKTAQETRLVRRLWARRGEAVFVPFLEVSMGNWKPQQHACHANADWWSMNNAGWQAIRGWWVLDVSFFGRVMFLAHSIVEHADGLLADITPAPTTAAYPFLRHHGDDEEYAAFISDAGVTQFDCGIDMLLAAEELIQSRAVLPTSR